MVLGLAKSAGISIHNFEAYGDPFIIHLVETPRVKIAITKILAQHGLNLQALSHDGGNAIHTAIRKLPLVETQKILDTIEFLIEQGVSVHQATPQGHQPFVTAAATKRSAHTSIQIMALLLKAGADINHRSIEGEKGTSQQYGALQWCIRNDSPAILDFLLRQPEIIISHRDEQGDSPLQLTLHHGFEKFRSFIKIIEHPAFNVDDLQIKDPEGLTPLERARKHQLREHLNYLEGPGLARIEQHALRQSTPQPSSASQTTPHKPKRTL